MKKILLAVTITMGLTVISQAAPTFKFFPSFGPPQNAVSFSSYTANAVGLINSTGGLPIGNRTSPNDPYLLQYIVPEDLMTTVSLPFYWDSFTPVSPFDNERGGTIWGWQEFIAAPGEPIALSDVTGTINSSDSGNILGKTYSFGSANYSPTAIGINLDGTQITSGPATQQVTGRIIVGIGYKSFTVGTSNDVQSVKNFIYAKTWSLTNTVSAKGASATFVLSTQPPGLRGMVIGGRRLLNAENNDDSTSYALQSSSNLTSGIWTSAGTIRAGQTNDFGATTNSALFIRYAP